MTAALGTRQPLLRAKQVTKQFGQQIGCSEVTFDVYPGEVIGIVGESGSGKTTLLDCLSAQIAPTRGCVEYQVDGRGLRDIHQMTEAARRRLMRTDWGIVRQNARDGLRMDVSAGGNVSERLMTLGDLHYGRVRSIAHDWLKKVELDAERLDHPPKHFSGGMQQRVQIARNLVTNPRLVFMDEPTGGLDVSVQARLLDLLRGLVTDLNLSAVLVTHDLAVTRLLAHRLLVMRRGVVVESGLTDQVLDDPQHAYTQLLVSSVLHP